MERTFWSSDNSATTMTTANFENHNKIDTAASGRIEIDATAEISPSSEKNEQATVPPSAMDTSGVGSPESNNVDSLESRETSDGKSEEQIPLIVYTIRPPESQVGSLDFTSAAVGSFTLTSMAHFLGHCLQIGLITACVQWISH